MKSKSSFQLHFANIKSPIEITKEKLITEEKLVSSTTKEKYTLKSLELISLVISITTLLNTH